MRSEHLQYLFRYSSECLSKVIKALDRSNIPDGKGRTGGYLALQHDTHPRPVLVVLLGEVSDDKAERYFRNVQKKLEMLGQNPSHVSTFESRDLAKEQYGGGIRTASGWRSAFSGLPEEGDLALCLLFAKKVMSIEDHEIVNICLKSNSTFASDLALAE